jgi:tetratricopeptide (TPR) repeat protein
MIEAHYNKAVTYKDLMDMPSCIRAYRKVVELGEHDDPVANNAQSTIDNIEANVLKLEGVNLDTFLAANEVFQRAFDFMRRGKWQQAQEGFRKAIAINERNVASHGNLGLCYAQLGYKAKALEELDRALELDPAYKTARDNRKLVATMTEGSPLKPTAFRIIESYDAQR